MYNEYIYGFTTLYYCGNISNIATEATVLDIPITVKHKIYGAFYLPSIQHFLSNVAGKKLC